MKGIPSIIVVALVVGAAIVGMMSLFTVNETKQAIVLRFGKVVKLPIQDPGLKVKLPWENVIYLDKRILVHDNPPVTVDVSENERLIVDAFARYQITDPLQFYQAVRTQTVVEERLSVFLDSSIREVVGAVGLRRVISGERREIMERISVLVQSEAERASLGIKVIDVRIKRADYPQKNMDQVFDRMRTERQKEAQLSRAKGEQRSREIKSSADRTVTVLLANAQRRSEEIRGEGDRYRNAIFNCAFGADPEFFAFYRSMQAYEKSFVENNTSMVLSPNSEFFRFFGDPTGSSGAAAFAQPSTTVGALSDAARADESCRTDGTYDLGRIAFLTSSAQLIAAQAATQDLTDDSAADGEASPVSATEEQVRAVQEAAKTGAWGEFIQAFPICSAENVSGNL